MASLLLIEDEESIREGLRDRLVSEGHQVFDAPNGRIGVQLFRQHHPNVVITDILMPEKDGLEVIMDVRKDRPGQCIIAMSAAKTAGLDLDVLNIARKLGASYTLEKPFDVSSLLTAIAACLSKESQRGIN